MEAQILQPEKPTGTNRNIFIIAGVIIVLCCSGLALASLGFYAYKSYSSHISQTGPIEGFTPIPPNVDSSTALPENNSLIDEAPTGGLGNDILRNDTWKAISAVAIGRGCNKPIGAKSTIEVLQQPDNGIWFEKWTVACQSGDSYAFKVQFILDNTGATYNITPLP